MKKFLVLVASATFFVGSVAQADLDTFHVIDIEVDGGGAGSGIGAFSGDITGAEEVTIWNNPTAGDDFWNEGDTGAFCTTVSEKWAILRPPFVPLAKPLRLMVDGVSLAS